ncbi:capsular polysaccharide synthesis protein [Rothia sp. 88186D007BW]
MNFLKPFKLAKHQVFLVKKNGFSTMKNRIYPYIAGIRPYSYDIDRYRVKVGPVVMPSSSTFLVNHLLFTEESSFVGKSVEGAPKQMFTIWFGDEMNKNRKRGIKVLKESNPDLDFHLITEENLGDWIKADFPLHPAFPYLSNVHQSDYIRTYLMHHYGGVYSDIKAISIRWNVLLEMLNSDEQLYAIGPSERTFENVAKAPGAGKLGKDQELYYRETLYPAAYVCKPYSPFTFSHYREIERRLDYFEDLLKENPAEQPWGDNDNYPVPWNALHGQIFSPLNLKFFDHIRAIPGKINNLSNHR